jgi:DNA-binding CsgD family transcriptional regulator
MIELLGRSREQDVLTSLIADGTRGKGAIAVVEGPAGIGKTTLLATARLAALNSGMTVLVGRGSEFEQEYSLGLVRQLLEPVTTTMFPDRERTTLFNGLREPASRTSDSDRFDVSFALLDSLYWLIADMCSSQPVAMVIDDLHWADLPSVRFLHYLLPRIDELPLVIVGASRPSEPCENRALIENLSVDPAATILRPRPLTQPESAQLVRDETSGAADDAFCLACHEATGGNPLLLRELVRVASAESVPPTAEGTNRLREVGARAVERRVAFRLQRLGADAGALARAAAVLGDDIDLGQAAALANLDTLTALDTMAQLTDGEILMQGPPINFVHPLIRAAVYETLTPLQRWELHTNVARLLIKAGATPEKAAAQLLQCPPTRDPATASVLLSAAAEATRRGSPENAVAYLERCLTEPLSEADRSSALTRLGAASLHVDVAKAAGYLSAALESTERTEDRAAIAEQLGSALLLQGRTGEAVDMLRAVIAQLPATETDWRCRLEAELLINIFNQPGLGSQLRELVERLRTRAIGSDVGGRMVRCMIGYTDMVLGKPSPPIIETVASALADGAVIQAANGGDALVCGMWTLIGTDAPPAIPLLDLALKDAHQRGSTYSLATVKELRCLAWLCRGDLAEAENDGREALRALAVGRLDQDVYACSAYLVNTLLEQGRIAEAWQIIEDAGSPLELTATTQWIWFTESKANLALARGEFAVALELLQQCAARFQTVGGANPALLPWRSTAALSLHGLGKTDEAQMHVAEELELARRCEVPRAVGRALRIAGVVNGGTRGLEMLREAVETLAPTQNKLERAKALAEYGSALLHADQRLAARQPLRHALELATVCGASPVVERARTELRASGAQIRRVALSGLGSITPSERRVAEMAAQPSLTNREIAQALFVTQKTVEIHLTSVYRKLGISARWQLPSVIRDDNRKAAS